MSPKKLISSLLALVALVALAVPAAAAARNQGAIVFSMVQEDHRVVEVEGKPLPPEPPTGGIYAARDHRLNQLTENPADTEPSFSLDGHKIAFVRDGDVFAMRADGSGLRRLTTGGELDSRPLIAPNGRYVLFERRAFEGAQRDLYTVRIGGGEAHQLVGSGLDEYEASIAPNGRSIVFVRATEAGNEDLIWVKPSGAGKRRLTRTAFLDEFGPVNLGGRVFFSRGERAEDASAYADIYSVRWDGRKLRKTVAGVGSAYIDDVSRDGRVLLFHRDQGLWLKRLGGRSRLVVPVAEGAEFNAVFASDGRKVALYQASPEEESITIVDSRTGRYGSPEVVAFPEAEEVSSTIGSAIAWQPVPQRGR